MKKLFLLVYVIGLLVCPWAVVFAQGGNPPTAAPSAGSFPEPSQVFSPLVGIPGLTNSTDLGKLLNALYVLAVTGGALLAVLVITFAGFKYMATDSVGSKEDAKNDIKSALLGLIIILSTALILRTISGDVNFNVLSGMPKLQQQNPAVASCPTGIRAPDGTCASAYRQSVSCPGRVQAPDGSCVSYASDARCAGKLILADGSCGDCPTGSVIQIDAENGDRQCVRPRR